MALRKSTRIRSDREQNEENGGIEDEMEKWKKVADMIGGTLDDVCNMAQPERNELLLLLSTDKGEKDNDRDLVNVDEFLDGTHDSDSDEEDLYTKQGNDNGNVYEPSLKKVKIMIERSIDKNSHPDLFKYDSSTESSTSVISNGNLKIESPIAQKITNDCTDQDDVMMSPIIKRRMRNRNLLNQERVNFDDRRDSCIKLEGINKLKTTTVDKNDEGKASSNGVIGKILSWNAKNKLNDGNTFEKIASNIECFKEIEKSPFKFKLNKKTSSNVSLEDIHQVFSVVKYIKSQAVNSLVDEPGLVNVFPDKSVKKGMSVLISKRCRWLESRLEAQEEGPLIEGISEINGDTRRPKRNTRSRTNTNSKVFGDMFDVSTPDSADEFQIDETGTLNGYDNLDYRGNVKKEGRAKNSTGKRRKPPGESTSCDNKDNVKEGKGTRGRGETRGRGKVKAVGAEVNKDGSQISMLNFVDKSSENFNENVETPSYNPLGHLVKLGAAGSSRSNATGVRGRGRPKQSHQEVQTGICPLCQKVVWESQLEVHASGCSGVDSQDNGNEELCPGCLKLIPSESYKHHKLGCEIN